MLVYNVVSYREETVEHVWSVRDFSQLPQNLSQLSIIFLKHFGVGIKCSIYLIL